jgi:hypothetical protein
MLAREGECEMIESMNWESGTKKRISNIVEIETKMKILGNKGKFVDVKRSGAREYGGNATFR